MNTEAMGTVLLYAASCMEGECVETALGLGFAELAVTKARRTLASSRQKVAARA